MTWIHLKTRVNELIRHRDFFSLLLFAVICGSLWLFIELADEMREGDLHAVDNRILTMFRSPTDPSDPLGPRWLDETVRDATALGSFFVLGVFVLATAIALWLERLYRMSIWILISSLGGLGLSSLFKNMFARERPNLLPTDVLPTSYSFPSGHSMLSAVVYLTAGALLTQAVPHRRSKAFVMIVALFLTLVTGLSRIYLGVHYPSDVLGGWTLGFMWAALCWLISYQTGTPHVAEASLKVRNPGLSHSGTERETRQRPERDTRQ